MAVVLVHGNLESPGVWDLLVPHLSGHPIIRLSPPGYGSPLPVDFSATPLEFRDWLIDQLETIVVDKGPVDLLGHDWGGIHVVNVAMARPDLLRSWVSDTIGMLDPDYEWHQLANIWQEPGACEAWVQDMLDKGVDGRASWFSERAVDPRIAKSLASGFNQTMGDTMLRLYRAAIQPNLAQLGAGLEKASSRPGLAVMAAADHFVGTEEQRYRSAKRAGAQVEVLPHVRHWWMAENPELGADAINRFWAGLGNT